MFANFGGSLLVLLLLCEVFCAVFGVPCSFVTGVGIVGVLWSLTYSNSTASFTAWSRDSGHGEYISVTEEAAA